MKKLGVNINFYMNKKKRISLKHVTLLIIIITVAIIGFYIELTNKRVLEENLIDNDIKNITEEYTNENTVNISNTDNEAKIVDINNIPEYFGKDYIEINNNIPYFTEEEKAETDELERYSQIDEYGRRGVAYINVCKSALPNEDEGRSNISGINPPGMQYQHSYSIISGGYLYNRSHLIAVQLGGDDIERRNIITGTKQLNTKMITWENKVRRYIDTQFANGNDYHVLYRVTPIYDGNNVIATGVEIESYPVEEKGNNKEVCFNIFIYNVQPGIKINYTTGENKESEE